jgi:hypothetical protein
VLGSCFFYLFFLFFFFYLFMRCQFSGENLDDEDVSLDGRVVLMNDTFRYLGSMLQSEGEIDEDVSH